MELLSMLVTGAVLFVAVVGISYVWDQTMGDAAQRRRKNVQLFASGDEWGHKKVDGHYIYGDEPLICPLSSTEFYRWEWNDFRDTQDWEYSHPEWPLTEHMSNEDGTMMKLVCVSCFEDRQDEIQARNNEVHEREQAEWAALSLEEKQERHDGGMQDTGPVVRLSDEGNYEKYNSEKGTWVRIPGSLNELTGRSD